MLVHRLRRNALLWYSPLAFLQSCVALPILELLGPVIPMAAPSRETGEKERLGYFLPLSYKGVSLPPHQHLIFPHLAVAATASQHPQTSCYFFSSVPCLHPGLVRDGSTVLLIGSVGELLLQSCRGAQNTGFIPVRPIHYLLACTPSGTKWWI